ncbi:hypothetical protein BDR04DRAFT_1109711 [Suillus decipiens]|nr:hypothetical protein BDR04DRAFT_1109711 [Suillus decipiens]
MTTHCFSSSQPSSPSPSGNESTGQPPRSVRKLFGKMTKRFARSARQSPNPERTAASCSSQDIQPVQSTKACNLNSEYAYGVCHNRLSLLITFAGSHCFCTRIES